MYMYDIAIITVNYKMKDRIRACLRTLTADLRDAELSVKIVVVDNASGDGIAASLAAEYPDVLCIENTDNVGFGKANNAGMAAVDASYYFIMNPDTLFIEPNTMRRLYEYMEREQGVGMIGPRLQYEDGAFQDSCFRFPRMLDKIVRQLGLDTWSLPARRRVDYFLMRDFNHQSTRPVDWILGSAMFVRGTALKAVGGFDERFFMYFEDCDWSRRFWAAHWPVYYVPSITLVHIYSRATAKSKNVFRSLLMSKLARIHLQSWWRYYRKWGIKANI